MFLNQSQSYTWNIDKSVTPNTPTLSGINPQEGWKRDIFLDNPSGSDREGGGELSWAEVRQMPAIWIFVWRRLPVLAAPSSQREVIGIKLGCDICRCEMEMICKYNCLWREQNINTRHDQGMVNIYLSLHTEIQNKAIFSNFLILM